MLLAAYQFSPIPGDAAANASRVERALRAAAARGAGLVALPELWPTSFAFGNVDAALRATRAALDLICNVSRECSLVVAGSALADSGLGKPYNLLHIIDRGVIVSTYAKTHLFTAAREDDGFTAGGALPPVATTSAGRIGGVICYDLRFPEICRTALLERADAVVVPAQWNRERTEQFRSLIIGRAVENQCYYIGVNRTGGERAPAGNEVFFPGRSIIANAFGEAISEAGPGEEIIYGEADYARTAALRRLIPCERDRRNDLYQ